MDKNQIENEYKTFKSNIDNIDSKEDFDLYLDIHYEDVDDNIKSLKKEKRHNNLLRLKDMLTNNSTYDDAYYKELDKLSYEEFEATKGFMLYIDEISSLYDSVDIKELVKLLDFTGEYFVKTIGYFDDAHKALEEAYIGITYIGTNPDVREAFNDFFEDKIESLTNKNKVLVK